MPPEKYETVNPHPSFLIKSISEQGYRLETSLADLIDNSVAAGADAVEILVSAKEEPFTLFLADNGNGMAEETLKESMRFPSASPDDDREVTDLGRFGLGMKTASFAQTRYFTVLSRRKGAVKYNGRTWDVDDLKGGEWKLKVNGSPEVESLLKEYLFASEKYLSSLTGFEPNTIIIWRGLRKFEEYLRTANRRQALAREVSEVTSDHLSLVFHKFMERKENPLKIRVNNKLLKPFSPFPATALGIRRIEYKGKSFGNDSIRLEGFVLPSSAIDESKTHPNVWTTHNKSLTDMEGMYFYRQNRLISYGGWNGIIRKAQRLQLARLKVELGNKVDHLLHLNVAKSQVVIPHDLHDAFLDYVAKLKDQAQKEFHNRGTRKFTGERVNTEHLFNRKATSKGGIFEVNHNYPLVSALDSSMTVIQKAQLKVLLQVIETYVNRVKQTHEDRSFLLEDASLAADDLLLAVKRLLDSGFAGQYIETKLLPQLGYDLSTIPREVLNLLRSKA
jgi:hypothetical protein